MKYFLIDAISAEDLEAKVNLLMADKVELDSKGKEVKRWNEGWKPLGAPFHVSGQTPASHIEHGGWWQAMVK